MKAKRSSKSPEEINAALAAKKGPISKFIARNYRHFNAAALLDAAKGYETHLAAGGLTLRAGAQPVRPRAARSNGSDSRSARAACPCASFPLARLVLAREAAERDLKSG